jgi:hypothetical protein
MNLVLDSSKKLEATQGLFGGCYFNSYQSTKNIIVIYLLRSSKGSDRLEKMLLAELLVVKG